MKLATVHCQNPNCSCIWETVMEQEQWHAKCPECLQEARVAGEAMGKEITGLCESCGYPLDDLHIFGRDSFACKPGRKKK